jgi:hypothetical protein
MMLGAEGLALDQLGEQLFVFREDQFSNVYCLRSSINVVDLQLLIRAANRTGVAKKFKSHLSTGRVSSSHVVAHVLVVAGPAATGIWSHRFIDLAHVAQPHEG